MPGSIQSIERAVAILRVLSSGPGPLRLSEISASLHLSKGTAHGILRTLSDVGFVEQDRTTGRYRVGVGLRDLAAGYIDPNELRARSMNWADPLAARSGEAVRVGILSGTDVVVVHYVFRPDHSPQHADVGSTLPGHATALGKVLLANNPGVLALLPAGGATSYTSRTLVSPAALGAQLSAVRSQGYAVEYGEYLPEQASIAAPILGVSNLVVGSVAVHGDLDRICEASGAPRPRMVTLVTECARSIAREIKTDRSEE
jgi:DNA-binding IclR family transcriptional regulator